MTCFKGSYSLIVSYSRIVSNYFESKSDIYSIIITIGLIYLGRRTYDCLFYSFSGRIL